MWKIKNSNKELEEELNKNNINKFLSRIMSTRNRLNNYNHFFKSDYANLSHPHALNGIDKAAFLFCKHIKDNSSIGLIGDFDADGIISSVMVYELCRIFNINCKFFIPSMFEHGYGLN